MIKINLEDGFQLKIHLRRISSKFINLKKFFRHSNDNMKHTICKKEKSEISSLEFVPSRYMAS